MSITDELRHNIKGAEQLYGCECKHLLAIADRIDAEYDKALNSVDGAYDSGYNVGYDEGFASADDWLAQHEDAMAEHGWYRALDADEQPIKFDDEVEHNGVVAKVLGITFHGTTPPTVCIVRGDYWVEADELRHYHKPTVEDVLREFSEKMNENLGMYTGEAIDADEWRQADSKTIAEYAAKLRLAEGEDA